MPKQTDGPILLMATSQDWGGVQAFLFDLAKEMKSRGLSVKVCAGSNHRNGLSDSRTIGLELGSKCGEAGIEFIELRHMARNINPWTNFLSIIELIRLFRRERPRAIHLNSTMMGVAGSLAARLAKVPWHGRSRNNVPWTVYCIGGWVFNEQLPGWKKKLYIAIEKISARWKDVIVCVHPGDEKLARDLNIKPRHLLTTVPNGIDVTAFEKQLLNRNLAREALRLPSSFLLPPLPAEALAQEGSSFLIATIANAYPPKNLLWYLDACKKIHERDVDVRFVVIGDGPQMDELRKKHADLKQEGYVLLAGRRMDAKSLYRAFDLFVLPSTKEGMSITLLEAMAAHVPIVATDVGANKWMAAGTIVQPNDIDAMADAVLALKADKNRRAALAEGAYREVAKRFTWQQTVEGTINTLFNHNPQ